MKRLLYLLGGILWLLFAIGFAVLMVQYIIEGTGLQFLGWVFSSTSVVIGMIQVTGIVLAVVISFAIGVALCAHGCVGPEKAPAQQTEAENLVALRIKERA